MCGPSRSWIESVTIPRALTGEVLERHYPLSQVVLDDPVPGLEQRTTGAVAADQGRFIYKVFETAGVEEDVERASYILEFLEQRSFEHAPRLLRTRNGSRTLPCEDRVVMVMERVEGEVPRASPSNYRKLGEIAGKLNRIATYPYDCPVTLARVAPEFACLAESLPDPTDRSGFLSLAASLRGLDDLPNSLIHFDMTLGNTIQRTDGAIVAIDWDDAGIGSRVFDASKPLISSFVSEKGHVFAESEARAFYEGYATQISLTDAERSAIVDAALFHALRYVVWGDPETRWRRIQWAVAHRQDLAAVIR